MNILFLTMSRLDKISIRGIYPDLLRYMRDKGHQIWLVSPRERSLGLSTGMRDVDGIHILGVRTLNLQKTNAIEKGVGQFLVEFQFRNAIRKYLDRINFDLIIYSTPPITLPKAVFYAKRMNPSALSYLLLKDIFPQNAVDLGMMSKGVLYCYFRHKEKELYRLSDYIGCMSPANVNYLLNHNSEILRSKVEIAPNSIALIESHKVERDVLRDKYGLPKDRPIFIYGGNLGKPQGISFLIDCLTANSMRKDCHFVVVGNGTEFPKMKRWFDESAPESVTVMERLPKEDYDGLVSACDVGLIFLDHRFTIPNFPSRLLPYLENRMPIIAATDNNSDTGKIAEANGFGFWCESNSVEAFTAIVDKMLLSDMEKMGERGYAFLCRHYLVQNTYEVIMKHFE